MGREKERLKLKHMKKIKSILIIAFLIAIPVLTFSQPDPRHNGNGSNVGSTPVGASGAPIDGGISIFLLLGVAYGTKNFMGMKKSDKKSITFCILPD